MSDDWERNIEVKGKCKTCGDTVSAAFVDEECMCCYYDYDHWDSSDEKAPWTILAKPGRGKGLKGLDITEEVR